MPKNMNDLIDKTAKIRIKTKFDTNWCDLPPEIKLECIKTIDFKTRFRLRSTSHTERSLVDSQRYKFEEVYISGNYLCISSRNYSKYDELAIGIRKNLLGMRQKTSEAKKVIPVLVYILKMCDIEYFDFDDSSSIEPIYDDQFKKLFKPESIRIKRLGAVLNDFDMFFFILKMCWKKMEKIEFGFTGKIPFDELISIPSVTSVKYLHVQNLTVAINAHQVAPLVQKWMENNVECGTKLQIQNICHDSMDRFISLFQNRIITRDGDSEENMTLRMRTDNESKHILVMVKHYKMFCVVISSNLKESEYEKYIDRK